MSQCTATARSGDQCRRASTPGATVCHFHGGAAPQVKRAAARRLALGRAMGEAGRLLDELGSISAESADPTVTILEAVARARQMALLFDELVAGLETKAKASIVDGEVVVSSQGIVGPDHLGDLRVHPYVELQRHWNGEAAKVAKAALDAGISERQMQLAEANVRRMAAAFRAFVVHLVDALVAAGLPAEQLRAVVGEQAPALMRRALEAARTEEA